MIVNSTRKGMASVNISGHQLQKTWTAWLHCLPSYRNEAKTPPPCCQIWSLCSKDEGRSQVLIRYICLWTRPLLPIPKSSNFAECLQRGNQSYIYPESLDSLSSRYSINTDPSRVNIYHVDVKWKFKDVDVTNMGGSGMANPCALEMN